MRITKAVLSLALLASLFACVQVNPPPGQAKSRTRGKPASREVVRVQNEVRALIYATFQNDLETMLRYTHPKVIEKLGGPEAARKALQATLDQVKQNGMQLEEFSFPQPPRFLRGKQRRFAIVATLSNVDTGRERVRNVGYQLGVLESGSDDWTYLDGAGISKANVTSLFPDFPADAALPATYRLELGTRLAAPGGGG